MLFYISFSICNAEIRKCAENVRFFNKMFTAIKLLVVAAI